VTLTGSDSDIGVIHMVPWTVPKVENRRVWQDNKLTVGSDMLLY